MSFTAKDLTAEKTKVLSAVRLPKDLAANTARGQYAKAGRLARSGRLLGGKRHRPQEHH